MATLHTHHFGPADGTPLLAIHGITAHGRRFERLCNDYLFDRHVVAPDLRGHGHSPRDSPWNLESHVVDLVELLDKLGWTNVDVMGHSLGGNLALRLLASHPDRVRRVLLLDPAFQIPQATADENASHALTDQSFRTHDDLIDARREGRSANAIPFSDADAQIAAIQGDDGRWRMNYEPAAVSLMWAELARELPPIKEAKPTLLINALQANIVTDTQIAYLETNLEEDLTQVELNLGHMLYWDDLVTTGRIVAGYVND